MRTILFILFCLVYWGDISAQTSFTYDASGNRIGKVVNGRAAKATLAGSQTVTAGQSASLTVTLTGEAPWSLTLTSGKGPISFTGISASSYACTVSPSESTTYTVGSVRNACGIGTASGTGYVTVLPTTCSTMFTVKSGTWSDPTVWSCNRVPASSDPVTVNHAVTMPINYLGNVLRIMFSSLGQVIYTTGSRLKIGP